MSFFKNLFNKKSRLISKTNYELFFTEPEISGIKLEVFSIGKLYVPSGSILACDPLVFLGDWKPFSKTINPGEYEVLISSGSNNKMR